MKNSVVHVRVNDQLKNNVEIILEELGLSLSFAININFWFNCENICFMI